MLVSKLHFHRKVDFLHSQALKPLKLFFFTAYNFSSFDRRKVLYSYFTLIRSKLEYASFVCNNLTLAILKSWKTHKKFTNLCGNRFIQPNSFCNYESILNYLHFKTFFFM
jgi:hypothetical protein